MDYAGKAKVILTLPSCLLDQDAIL